MRTVRGANVVVDSDIVSGGATTVDQTIPIFFVSRGKS